MLTRGPARKVTVHLNEDTSSEQGFLYQQVLSLLLEQGVGGATLSRLKPASARIAFFMRKRDMAHSSGTCRFALNS
jgi:PII-like signaling protein